MAVSKYIEATQTNFSMDKFIPAMITSASKIKEVVHSGNMHKINVFPILVSYCLYKWPCFCDRQNSKVTLCN